MVMPLPPPGSVDWELICWRLMHGKARLRPWEIRNCTLSEIAMYLDEDEDRKPRASAESTPIASQADLLARAAYWKSVTPRERLKMLRSQS